MITGKERDAETGLDFFGARYFSGAQGRFTSPDQPLVDQNPFDPQSWNLYNYVRNNPGRFRDESGRSCVNSGGSVVDDKPGSGAIGDDNDGKGCTTAGVDATGQRVDPDSGEGITADTSTNVPDSSAPVQGSTEERRENIRDLKYLINPSEQLKVARRWRPIGPTLEGPRVNVTRRSTVPSYVCALSPGFIVETADLIFGTSPGVTDPLVGNEPGPYWLPNGRQKNGGQDPIGSPDVPFAAGAAGANYLSNSLKCLALVQSQQ